jgi:glutaredoxin 3
LLLAAYFLIKLESVAVWRIMSEKVLIFGQDLCPYTSAARADFSRRKIAFEYINVLEDDAGLERMLKLTNGRRKVPVIFEAGKVTIGFGGS